MSRLTLRAALIERRDCSPPSMRVLIAASIGFLALYIGLSLWFAPDGELDYHFRKERGMINALSTVLLGVSCWFAAGTFIAVPRGDRHTRRFWLLLAAGLGFLMLDECLQFHESIGELIEDSAIGMPAVFRNWNDIIVIGYMLIAVVAAIYFLPQAVRIRRFTMILVVGFLFFSAHTLIDATQEPSTTLSVILEEIAKVCTSASIALAMFVACTITNARTASDPAS